MAVMLGLIVSYYWCNLGGKESGFMGLFYIFVGTLFFIATGGSHRCFYTFVFTGLTVGGCVLPFVYEILVIEHEWLSREVVSNIILIAAVGAGIPSGLAWLVTLLDHYLNGEPEPPLSDEER